MYTVSLIHVINFSFLLISSDEIKCPFFNVVYFKCFIDFSDFRCYFFHDCILSSQFNTALMQTNYYKVILLGEHLMAIMAVCTP